MSVGGRNNGGLTSVRLIFASLMFAVGGIMLTSAFHPLAWALYVSGGFTAIAFALLVAGRRDDR